MQTSLDWFLENLPERFKYALLNTCEEGIKKAKQNGTHTHTHPDCAYEKGGLVCKSL